jgi:hypothetical protein
MTKSRTTSVQAADQGPGATAVNRLGSLPICLVLVARPHGRRLDAIRAYDLRAGTARDSPTLPRICSTQQGSRLRGGDRTSRGSLHYLSGRHRRWRIWGARRIILKVLLWRELS